MPSVYTQMINTQNTILQIRNNNTTNSIDQTRHIIYSCGLSTAINRRILFTEKPMSSIPTFLICVA